MAERKVRKGNVMSIGDIHRYETCMFWIERLAILTLLLFPTAQLLHISSVAALILCFTNLFYLCLSLERQFIRSFFFEPDAIFYIERPAILITLLRYVLPDAYSLQALGLTVLILTNFVTLDSYKRRRNQKGKDLAMNSSNSSSKTKKTTNAAEETIKNIDHKPKKDDKAKGDQLLDKKVELKQEVNNMGGSNNAVNSITNHGEWFSSSFWDSLVPKEEALRMNSTPFIQIRSPIVPEPSKEESVVIQAFKLIDPSQTYCLAPEFNEELQEERENNSSSASKEVKMEKKDDQKDVTAMVDEVKEVNDEAGAESDLTSNVGVNLKYGLHELIGDIEVVNQVIREVGETKYEVQVAAGSNYSKSDDDSSWEEVQQDSLDGKLCAEIASSDQKKTDELEEVGHKQEVTSSMNWKKPGSKRWLQAASSTDETSTDECSSDESIISGEAGYKEEVTSSMNWKKPGTKSWLQAASSTDESSISGDESSSWKEGEIDLNRKKPYASSVASSTDFLQEQLHLYEAMSLQWEQEQNDLTEKLEVATKFWKQYEENYNKLQKEVSVQCTDMINELKSELLGVEKLNLKAKLDAAAKKLEHYQVMEKEYAEDRHKWNEGKEDLNSKLNAATDTLQEERLKWEDEKGELLQKLEATAMELGRYKEVEKGFAEERNKWDEEKNTLNATIGHADENVQYCQTLVNTYAQHCRLLGTQNVAGNHCNLEDELKKLKEERDYLSAQVKNANCFIESYKARCDRSEKNCKYYKASFEEYEEKYRKLKEENADMSAKFFTEASFAERYKRLVNDLEDKFRKLEEEKIELTAKLCASKAASELYRTCLLDFPS